MKMKEFLGLLPRFNSSILLNPSQPLVLSWSRAALERLPSLRLSPFFFTAVSFRCGVLSLVSMAKKYLWGPMYRPCPCVFDSSCSQGWGPVASPNCWTLLPNSFFTPVPLLPWWEWVGLAKDCVLGLCRQAALCWGSSLVVPS